jgi:hypothetical protein
MGLHLVDAYSLLHFAVGVVVRHWGMSLVLWIVIHTMFEVIENTQHGMNFINRYIKMWPGGKPYADSVVNNIGDTVFAVIGWYAADQTLGTK